MAGLILNALPDRMEFLNDVFEKPKRKPGSKPPPKDNELDALAAWMAQEEPHDDKSEKRKRVSRFKPRPAGVPKAIHIDIGTDHAGHQPLVTPPPPPSKETKQAPKKEASVAQAPPPAASQEASQEAQQTTLQEDLDLSDSESGYDSEKEDEPMNACSDIPTNPSSCAPLVCIYLCSHNK